MDTRGGGGQLGVIWYGCASQFFETYPNHILGLRKKWSIHILDWTQCLHIYIYTVLWFLYTLFAVCKLGLQINITILVSELNIWAKLCLVVSNRDVGKWDHSYINDEKLCHLRFLRKRGLIVYLAAQKKGAIRHAHPYYVLYTCR